MSLRLVTPIGLLLIIGSVLDAAPHRVAIKPQEQQLDNGLRIVILEDHLAPIVSVVVGYAVGSRDDPPGRSGLAHLFEHMMFDGSANVGPREHSLLINRVGGRHQGQTLRDASIYHNTVPAHQLELALFLEADRMSSLEITEQSLRNQKDAVKEERRLKVDNVPGGSSTDMLNRLLFGKAGADPAAILGPFDEIAAITLDDARSFYRTHYGPNNAVITLAGDVNARTAIDRIRTYFGRLPSRPGADRVPPPEPRPPASRRLVLHDPLGRNTRLDAAWRIPAHANPGALQLAASVLGGGRSSRLYQRLVRLERLATDVIVRHETSLDWQALSIQVMAREQADMAAVETAMHDELSRIAREPLRADEIRVARTFAASSWIDSLPTPLFTAIQVTQHVLQHGSAAQFGSRLTQIESARGEDVRRLAEAHLRPDMAVTIVTIPKAAR